MPFVDFSIMLPLYPHQTAAITKALTRNGTLALFHSPGLGKTRTCLELYTQLRRATPDLKLLVVCPISLIDAAWGVDIEKFTSWTYSSLRKGFAPVVDIGLINYEAIIRPATQRKLLPWANAPKMLVLDESSRLRDPSSLTTKTLLTLAPEYRYRVVCSGTPSPNGLYELWAQIKLIDPNLVHRSFWAWRREYFHLGRHGRTMPEPPPNRMAMASLFQSGWTWQITQANQDRLLTRLLPATHWVRKEDALPNLPERLTTMRHVTLSEDEQRAYDTMKRQLVVEFHDEAVTAELALTKLMKLRQLASGFLYGATVHVTGTARLRLLKETLEDLGEQNVIIWANFHQEIEQIAALLGDQAVTLYAKTKDRAESLRRFGTTARYLIAHPRSAGHGLTLTQASTIVWYSLDWSLEAYSQANDRIHRIGQTQSCLYVHLIGKDLIDAEIWSVLQRKTTLQAAIHNILGQPLRSDDSAAACESHYQTVADRVGVSSE